LIGTVFLAGALRATEGSAYDVHVLFTNAPASGGLPYAMPTIIAPSTLELQGGRFPTDTDHFVSPPNALRLRWKSAQGGDWQIRLQAPNREWARFDMNGGWLSFWCFSDKEITALNSPRVYLKDRHDYGSIAMTFVLGEGRIPAGKWVRVMLDFSDKGALYRGTDDRLFNVRDTVSINFMQGLDDGQEHTVYLDDFMLIDPVANDTSPPPAPAGLSAKGYERHCGLSWNPVTDKGLLTYRIYRSSDDKEFKPIATQRANWVRY
jgi:hypothetical protein